MINIYQPDINNYSESACDAIKSGWISNHGKYIELANKHLHEKLGCKYSILMANGTCATHCIFLSIKFKHPEIKKIYVPNNAYVAAWNSCLSVYRLEQMEVMKMNNETWNIETNEEYINSLDYGAGVLIVHNLGNIINVPRLKRLRPDLVFVEDNCEGIFGKYEGMFSGTESLCASLSFYGNKIITTGEGGAFLTNHRDVYEYIKRVFSQGMSETRYLHDIHAYNYRMTNIQAAFLYDQLRDIDTILVKKRKVFDNYEKLFQENNYVSMFKIEENTEKADWMFAIRILGNKKSIEETTEFFRNRNVDIRPFFYPINSHRHLSEVQGTLTGTVCLDDVSAILNREVIMIPSSPTITKEEQQIVANVVSDFIRQAQIV